MQPDAQETTDDPGFWTKTSFIQLGYGIWVTLSVITIGLAMGFSAVALPQLTSSASKVNITLSEQSWIASVLTLVSPVGCVSGGYLIDKFGRRLMLIFSHLPVGLGWLYTGYATSAKQIIIGRIITGVGIGMVMSVPRVYLAEISLPNMRGVIGSLPNVAISIGITIQATLGSFFKWTILCYISSSYSLALFIINIGLPETPYYLLRRTSTEHAKASLKKLRSKIHDIDAEMKNLIEYKTKNDIQKISFKNQLRMVIQRSTCKPFWLILTYLTMTQLSGVTVVAMWTVEMLQNSKCSVDANLGNVVMAFTRFGGGVCTAIAMFRIRRRIMAIISGIGVGLASLALGVIIRSSKEPTVFPLICYVIYILFATFGHYIIPLLLIFELYPLQIRGLMGGILTSMLSFLISGANWCYPHVRDTIGFANTITAFGVSSLSLCVFLYFFLPETKGLTLQETEAYYKD